MVSKHSKTHDAMPRLTLESTPEPDLFLVVRDPDRELTLLDLGAPGSQTTEQLRRTHQSAAGGSADSPDHGRKAVDRESKDGLLSLIHI